MQGFAPQPRQVWQASNQSQPQQQHLSQHYGPLDRSQAHHELA